MSVDVIIHSGFSNTFILVIGEEQPLFFRELNKGTDTFIREIMQRDDNDYVKVSKHLIENGIYSSDTDINDNLGTEINVEITKNNPYNDLIDDIRKTLRYYLKNNTNTHYNNFFLSGGGTQLNGFKELIDEKLLIDTNYLNPFINIEYDEMPRNYMHYTIATGLALRALIK